MVVGMVPLIVADGAGAKSRFAIGIVIAAGMSIGTIFTLFVTPAIYTLIARNRGGKRGEVAFVLKGDDKPVRHAAE
jgi:Cu/Ag efflux pump CusA